MVTAYGEVAAYASCPTTWAVSTYRPSSSCCREGRFVGVDHPVRRASGCLVAGPLQADVDVSGARGEHLDDEQGRGGQIALGERRPRCHQQVGLHNGVLGQRYVERREQHLEIGWTPSTQQEVELAEGTLVPSRGRRGHDETPVDELVTTPVIGHRREVLAGQRASSGQRGHSSHGASLGS